MRQWLTMGVGGLAVLASVATSAPNTQWVVVGGDKASDVLDRDTNLAVFDVEIEANAEAMELPSPVWEDEGREPGEPLEITDPDPSFTGELRVRLKAATKGVMGIDSDATDVTLRVLDDDGVILASETLFADTLEPASFDLWVPGAFAGCAVQQSCEDAFSVEIETTDRSKLRVKLEVYAWLRGAKFELAPKEADIDVVLTRI